MRRWKKSSIQSSNDALLFLHSFAIITELEEYGNHTKDKWIQGGAMYGEAKDKLEAECKERFYID